ncbi:peptidoglycan-binding domain-containing protein [Phormidesmis sp. 146-33]
METLGYLHLACENELPKDFRSPVRPLRILDSLNWQKLPSGVWVKFLSIAVSLTILSLASAAMALLQEGDRGSEVGNLQNQLTNKGCYSGLVDEVFGPQTREAVITCQRRLGIVPDGIVGPATLSALASSPVIGGSSQTLNPMNNLSGILRLGSRGSAVSDLQNRLSAAGYYTGTIDGVFGPQTESAVIRLQRDWGLTADGVVGSQVYQALNNSAPIEPTTSRPPIANSRELTIGSSGSDVEDLQRRLSARGYFEASPTGYYGSITRDAVLRFQAAQRLPQTGIADARTLNQLGIGTIGSIDQVNRYHVVIPKQGAVTLSQVRQFFPAAVERTSKLGDYVEAGRYPNVERADRQSNLLRAKGLDARVAYR